MNPCAVCGDPTDAPECWGRHVCTDCRYEPVVFTARCTRFDCQWSATAEVPEYKRGAGKRQIQMKCNTHERGTQIIERQHGHVTEYRERDHADGDVVEFNAGGQP